MVTPFFKNIREQISNELRVAHTDIKVAVCWFTCEELLTILCDKLKDNKTVTVIILNDTINNKLNGLNFQNFIDLGGVFYFSSTDNPMHNKYCIIDSTVLINGSYNWTYYAESKNYENITIFKSDAIVNYFIDDFNNLMSHCQIVSNISKEANTNAQQMTVIENVRLASDTDIIINSRKEIGERQQILTTSLGEKISNDDYYVFLPKGSKIPAIITHTLTTVSDNQKVCNTDIRAGENFKGSLNNQIGKFTITGIPPLPKGSAGLITTFLVDEYGILTISIKIRETGCLSIQKFNIEHLIN